MEKYVRLMADYSSSGLWCSFGGMFNEDELPVSDEIKKRIENWMNYYEENNNSYNGEDDDFDYKTFSETGELIAEDIKKELPDWTVVYFNEYRLREIHALEELIVTEGGRSDFREDRSYFEYEIKQRG